MINDKDIVAIKNRSTFTAVYKVPDLGIRRTFQAGEVKKVTAEEIRKLGYTNGGMVLLKDIFVINEKELIEELGIDIEPEYYYTEEDVKKLLLTGNMDQFLDCLDFAPKGVLEMVKDLAVSLKIDNYSKRQAIQEELGFNVTNAIENEGPDIDEGEKEEAPKRRVKSEETTTTSERRYKVIK